MKRSNYILIFVFISFIGCNKSIKGRIDYRMDNKECYPYEEDEMAIAVVNGEYSLNQRDIKTKSAYLVNESIDKAYEFTIKTIETTDDSIVSHTITKIKLSPGDEKRLGCTNYNDVLMNEDKTKSPKIRHRIVLNYTCTGQRLITNSKELDGEK